MKYFIDQLAELLLEKQNNLSDVCVVFPNRRPIVFFYRALGQLSENPIIAPQCYSIKDFVYAQVHLQQTDNTTLLFSLFDTYKKVHTVDDKSSFENFISSGELMLADFNDIDNYMVDAYALFSNLDKAKAIELWNPGKDRLTKSEEAYLAFFQKLFDYYKHFKENLFDANMAYDGMAYRFMADEVLNGKIFAATGVKYVFAGFNALNEAEKIIINHFVQNANAKLIWDADAFFVQDKSQEAGRFIRDNLRLWSENTELFIGDSLLQSKKNIHIVGAPLHVSQSKYVGQVIDEMHVKDKNALNKTAIIPGDESTLFSLMESMPPSIEGINITMGYNVKQSKIYELMASYISLSVKAFKVAKKSEEPKFYYRDVIVLLQNPLFAHVFPSKQSSGISDLTRKLLSTNQQYYSSKQLKQLIEENSNIDTKLKEMFFSVFEIGDTTLSLIDKCICICNAIDENTSDVGQISKEMTLVMLDLFNLLKKYDKEAGFPISPNSFELLFQRLSSGMQVPFEGEPLGGLQIMGFLETRCLDFENIIISNFNEGFIPAGNKRMQTFIPFDLRQSFHMPMPGHKDAMYAYYLLRLLQKAKNIYITYNTEPDNISGKEMSRFVKQIEFELKQKSNNNWNVTHNILQVNAKPFQTDVVHESVVKNQIVMDIIHSQALKGYSSSRLFCYMTCQYKYYLKYILQLEAVEDEISSSIEMHTLGTVVHDTLCEIYNSSINRVLDALFFTKAKNDIEQILNKNFEKHYAGGDMSRGKNLLISEVAKKMVQNVLKFDQIESKNHVIVPLMLEQKIDAEIIQNNTKYKLTGLIDRVDRYDEVLRIADYKTGKLAGLKILGRGETPNSYDFQKINNQQFQLLFYIILFQNSQNNAHVSDCRPLSGIIALKHSKITFNPLVFSDTSSTITMEFLNDFQNYICALIDELQDVKVDFNPTLDDANCKYCEYGSICQYFSHKIHNNETED
jgi:ATP-dependent helicase/nuclease subunit B